MNTETFERLLKRVIGLDAASIGSSAVERAVRARMTAIGCGDPQKYAERLEASAEEMQALVEAVVVPETWFYRDAEAFAALTRRVHERWLRAPGAAALRVLSAPCSTGEEPYSIAIALLEAGLPPERFRIEAIDVSEHALARAERAIYGRNSFRGAELAFRERYFRAAGPRWELSEAVRRQVHFQAGNLLDPALLAAQPPFDVIFCRNVLIYFDRPTQDRAMAGLTRLLAPDGWIFVGPSETALLLSHGFESVKAPLAFAFRRGSPKKIAPKPEPVAARRVTRPVATRKPPASAPVARPFSSVPAAPAPASSSPDPWGEIRRLADEGHFAEAAQRCEEQLRAGGPSAKALYLLAVIRDAAGQHGEAAGLYRKALYLDPNHHDALMQLAYLLERQGDAAGAKVLAARARRVAEKAQR